LSETFLNLRRNERDMIKNAYLYSCPILMKLEFSRHIFEKSSNIQFHENPSSGIRVVPCGPKDRRTDMTKLIVVFRNFANAPKTGACTYVSRGYELSIFVFTDPTHYDSQSAITFIILFLSYVQIFSVCVVFSNSLNYILPLG
jgi:hypothetical protein